MEDVTLEQVREYFKDAKVVRCLSSLEPRDITKEIKEPISYAGHSVYTMTIPLWHVFLNVKGKYAEILEYNDNIKETHKRATEKQPPEHYDNSISTLYKVALQRNWNPYLFDIVKRLERADKKGEFESDLKKSKIVIDLWLKENNEELILKAK